jgi:DNA-binding response OmpR family regulator
MNAIDAHSRREIEALRNRIDEQAEEIRQLRQVLRPSLQWPREWGLTPAEEATLSILFSREHPVSASTLAMLTCRSGEISRGVIKVRISNMRPKLARLSIEIETSSGRGYMLSAVSRLRLRVLQRGMQEVSHG